MKVIKVITHTGLCCQDYGAEIQDNFAVGTYTECREAIKGDIVFNAQSTPDSGSELVFFNGEDLEGISLEDKEDQIEEYFVEADDQMDCFVIRLHEDDVYSSIYEVTYRILEDSLTKVYFTFGSDPSFPYQNTYIVVEGRTEKECLNIFRLKYPDRHKGCINCAFWYSEERWNELGMFKDKQPAEILKAA